MKIGTGSTFVILWALLCLGCAPVGTSDAEVPAASNGETTGENMAAKDLQGLEETREITEGSFRSLTIGEPKDQVLAALRKMGATRIKPGLGDRIVVMKAEDLSRLQDVEGVILGTGEITIAFDGNDVRWVSVAPVYPEWNALLNGARTRQEVFRALAQILEQSKDLGVRALAVNADNVWVNRMTPESQVLLDKYDHWSVAADTEDGYLHMDLDFERGALRRISVLESPAAL